MKQLVTFVLAAALLTTVLTGCFIDVEEQPRPTTGFNVIYSVTKQFASDTARLEYTSSSGALTPVTDFSGMTFSKTVSVGAGVPVELKAQDIFGELKLGVTVERTSNKELVFESQKTCTAAAAACTVKFTTP